MRPRNVSNRCVLLICSMTFVGALLFGVLVLPPTWRDEERYGETHGSSLRGMLGASDVAALAEVVSGDGRFDGSSATYRIVHPLAGPVAAGDTLQVVGPGRLPYLGRNDFAMFGDGYYIARPGTRVVLFLRRDGGSSSFVPVAPSGVLAVDRLCFWMMQPPPDIEEVFLPALDELAAILRLPPGAERDHQEAEWAVACLDHPFTAERAVDDLILNWRKRPPIDVGRPWPRDACDVRSRFTPTQERRLVDALGNRRLPQAVRADLAWILAELNDARIDDLLRAELADALAVDAFDRNTPGVEWKEPAATFPGDQFPDLNLFWARQLLAVMAQRAGEPALHALLLEYDGHGHYDDGRGHVARRFLRAWDE